MLQDSKGYIWIGTLDGLNKFDGYTFKIYKPVIGDSNSISSNTIFSLYEDSNQDIWIGTLGGGLNQYVPGKDNFIRFEHDSSSKSISNNNVRTIFEDKDHNLWVGTENGLNQFIKDKKSFKRFLNKPQSSGSLSNNTVWDIDQDSEGNLWIGTYGGLNKFNPSIGTFRVYENNSKDLYSISHNYVWDISPVEKNKIWIGTNNGLNLLNTEQDKFQRVNLHEHLTPGTNEINIWDVYTDTKNNLWLGSLGNGLFLVENSEYTNSNAVRNFRNNPALDYSLSHDFVWSIIEDNSGLIWIGTDIGIDIFSPFKHNFLHFSHNPYIPNSLSNNEATAFCETANGLIWIGTKSGINKFSGSDKFSFDANSIPAKLRKINIRTIYRDKENVLWIGTNNNGLLSYDGRNINEFKYSGRTNEISSNTITSIIEDHDKIFWIGTLSGLNRFDRSSNNFEYYLNDKSDLTTISHDYVYDVYEDSEYKLWVATFGGGLNLFDKNNKTFSRFMNNPEDSTSIINNYIWHIFEDSENRLWIGTNNGLELLDRNNNTFSHIRIDDLLSNAVYGILEDDNKFLWLSTNRGLIKYDHRNKISLHYDHRDGLQSNQFNGGAVLKSSTGEFYLGGINGFNIFNPDSVLVNMKIPPVVLTKIDFLDERTNDTHKGQVLQSLTNLSPLELDYSSNTFLIEFSALDYSIPSKNKYAYKLEGLDDKWIYCGNRRFVTYTNLEHGNYIFKVKGSNNDGVWNETGINLSIVVNPPFWLTWWFMALAAGIVIGVIVLFVYDRISHLIEIERLRVKISEDLHDDIGTRLTEISLLSDLIHHKRLQNPEMEVANIKKVGDIARSLIDNMSDIVWLINPKRDTLYELFMKLRDIYEEILSHREIDLYVNDFKFLEKIRLPMDYRKNLYLIFKEALNNSIKHSECNEISINAMMNGRKMEITLYDNGKGFKTEEHHSGNGLINMHNRAKNIGGNLRIQSSPEFGTMIKFQGKI